MKKLMAMAALAALSAGAFAEAAAPAPAAAEQKVPAAAAAAPAAGARPEARRRPMFDRAQFEARMRERQAERRAKVVELLKGAGVPEDKAPALAEEIDGVYSRRAARPQRPPRMHGKGPEGGRGPRPQRPPQEPKKD